MTTMPLHEMENVYDYRENLNADDFVTRLNKCQAWYTSDSPYDEYVYLKSYNTIVACYCVNQHTLISFGRYSSTTYQHVRKFRNAMAESYRICAWDISEYNLEKVPFERGRYGYAW